MSQTKIALDNLCTQFLDYYKQNDAKSGIVFNKAFEDKATAVVKAVYNKKQGCTHDVDAVTAKFVEMVTVANFNAKGTCPFKGVCSIKDEEYTKMASCLSQDKSKIAKELANYVYPTDDDELIYSSDTPPSPWTPELKQRLVKLNGICLAYFDNGKAWDKVSATPSQECEKYLASYTQAQCPHKSPCSTWAVKQFGTGTSVKEPTDPGYVACKGVTLLSA